MLDAGLTLCIAIPTFRRPLRLAELLAAIAAQRLSERPGVVEVVVMDNDPHESAAAVVGAARPGYPFALEYRPVPAAGLACVRNAALAHAAGRFDLLAMIDDDEVPVPEWLDALLEALRANVADAAVGPVPQVLPPSAPRWLSDGRFFDIPAFPDGSVMADGYTGNCIVRMAAVDARALRFDERLNFKGGEDQLFFRQLVHRGGRIVFAARAVAVESVPESRATLRYLCRRYYRGGNSLAFCDRQVHGTVRMLALRAAKGLGLIALGAMGFVPRAALRGPTGAAASVCAIARGAGMLGGLAGLMTAPYARSR